MRALVNLLTAAVVGSLIGGGVGLFAAIMVSRSLERLIN